MKRVFIERVTGGYILTMIDKDGGEASKSVFAEAYTEQIIEEIRTWLRGGKS